MKTFSNFTEAYLHLLSNVYEGADFESAPRGHKIKEKIGCAFKISNPRNRLPYLKSRDYSIAYFIAESLWYLSGNDSTEWISNYSSFWRGISDDGSTANSAYGSRIFKPHDRIAKSVDSSWTQWNFVIEELCADPDSRRAVIHVRSPQDSILAKKDVPCTLTLQFFLRNDNLHMVVSMRSSDLILGLAYDVPAFTLFQEILAVQLSERLNRKIGLGEYTHISNSLHIYEKHFDMTEKILNSNERVYPHEMPALESGSLPIEGLQKFEKACRNVSTKNELYDIVWAVPKFLATSDPYWKDWAIILASHRAAKMGIDASEIVSQKNLLKNTSFLGYRCFDK